ncbi:hypothetical protein PoB_005572300 [Plakobranchus ocellatus]|uniref:Uncharacterized protein n=1 Tax=Plakobranchus ocellatus TaxID=259542 RepID=A0AAV4CE36_9GAST|nr:hypothetical protein PoB_005572300 [Plakobranchus ocellatus]
MIGGVGGTVASESALTSAGTLLSRVRTPPPAPCPDGGPESLRSPCCVLALHKNQTSSHLMITTALIQSLITYVSNVNLVKRAAFSLL